MLLVLALLAALWILGWVMKTPRSQRVILSLVVLSAVILAHLVLPADTPIRQATGGSATPWLFLICVAALIWGYTRLLTALRSRARAPQTLPPSAPFSEAELSRYARHMILREIGGPGQRALKEARVLVVGAGGLGAPACLYLAGAGVGTIGVIDDDTVETTNLQRQIIHRDADVSTPKTRSAARAMAALNPHISVRPYQRRLTPQIAAELFADYDLILDGTDNFDTRYLVNATCVALGKPLIAAALTQWEGQISTYDPAQGAPCYACVFPSAPSAELAPSCAEAGVAGPLPGILGSMMALEAVKLITGAGTSLRGRLAIHDGLHGENRTLKVARRPDCPTCSHVTASSKDTP